MDIAFLLKDLSSVFRLLHLVSGLGWATADAAFGFAGFGLALISNIMIHQQAWLQLIGGVFYLEAD